MSSSVQQVQNRLNSLQEFTRCKTVTNSVFLLLVGAGGNVVVVVIAVVDFDVDIDAVLCLYEL